ncbi:MAG: hypothetical protein WDW38_007474 [Sanguina aurantia]
MTPVCLVLWAAVAGRAAVLARVAWAGAATGTRCWGTMVTALVGRHRRVQAPSCVRRLPIARHLVNNNNSSGGQVLGVEGAHTRVRVATLSLCSRGCDSDGGSGDYRCPGHPMGKPVGRRRVWGRTHPEPLSETVEGTFHTVEGAPSRGALVSDGCAGRACVPGQG